MQHLARTRIPLQYLPSHIGAHIKTHYSIKKCRSFLFYLKFKSWIVPYRFANKKNLKWQTIIENLYLFLPYYKLNNMVKKNWNLYSHKHKKYLKYLIIKFAFTILSPNSWVNLKFHWDRWFWLRWMVQKICEVFKWTACMVYTQPTFKVLLTKSSVLFRLKKCSAKII